VSGPVISLELPHDAMVLLVGPSGSGKSTFASSHFRPTEVLSSDEMRAMVADDPNDQTATEAAFELLHTALEMRLLRGRLTVVDATNLEAWSRALLLAIARRHRRPAAAIVLSLPLAECLARNAVRSDRRPAASVRRQHRLLGAAVAATASEGYARSWILRSPLEVAAVRVTRQ